MRDIQKESLAWRCLASGKTPVFVDRIDYDGFKTEKDGKPMSMSDIKRGGSVYVPCHTMAPITKVEHNEGFQVGKIFDYAIMDKDFVIESRAFMFSSINFEQEYVRSMANIAEHKEALANMCISNNKTPFFIQNIDLDNIKYECKPIELEEIHGGMTVSFSCSYKRPGESMWKDGHCTVNVLGGGLSHGNLLTLETSSMVISCIDFSEEYERGLARVNALESYERQ